MLAPGDLNKQIRDLKRGQKLTLWSLSDGRWQANLCFRGEGWTCEIRDTPEEALQWVFYRANRAISWPDWETLPPPGCAAPAPPRPADYAEEFI